MNEREFLKKLQNRAQEQEQTLKAIPFPTLFRFVTDWLAFNPWRIIIPLAIIFTLLLRLALGPHYIDMVLKLFRIL